MGRVGFRVGSGGGSSDFLKSENYWEIMAVLFVALIVVPLVVYYIKNRNVWDG